MKDKGEKRLSVGAIIEDKKSFEEYRITGLNKKYVYFTGIRGVKVSGAIPKAVFHDDFIILREGWKR